jgi:hypothetical protein
MDFSVIQADPTIRALVQDNSLVRQFRDPLLPRNLFRGEAAPVHQPGNAGDNFVFTGAGLMSPSPNPRNPKNEPAPKDYQKEQWSMQLHEYYDRCPDTHMPTSIVAIVNLLNENLAALGKNAGQTLDRAVRNRLYNAGLSGNTVATANASSTTVALARLNGFTTSRRPDLSTGSPVQFQAVSSNNPLVIHYLHSGTVYTTTVTGYTPTFSGDEVGPGTITTADSVTITARDPVWTDDCSNIVRPAAVSSIDALTSTSTHAFTFDLYRQAIGRLEEMSVPKFSDGYYHVHMNSYSKAQLFTSTELRQLLTSLPDHYWFKKFTLGEVLGGIIFNDVQCPRKNTVIGGNTNTYVGGEGGEMFGGETISSGSGTLEVQRPIFIGAEAVFEYYNDLSGLTTEAGVCGVVGEFQPAQLTNNGVEINVDRVQVYIRAPVNVKGDIVTSIWRSIMDWPTRTDATTGDSARFKRCVVVEHV